MRHHMLCSKHFFSTWNHKYKFVNINLEKNQGLNFFQCPMSKELRFGSEERCA